VTRLLLLQVPHHVVQPAQAWEEGLQSPPDSCPITSPAQITLLMLLLLLLARPAALLLLQVPHHPLQPAQAWGEGLQDPRRLPVQLHHLRQLHS
jgi:hypothetical protein